ncbi:MAG: hypothetical protein AAGC95_05695 [Pseudomonadota bacterium]
MAHAITFPSFAVKATAAFVLLLTGLVVMASPGRADPKFSLYVDGDGAFAVSYKDYDKRGYGYAHKGYAHKKYRPHRRDAPYAYKRHYKNKHYGHGGHKGYSHKNYGYKNHGYKKNRYKNRSYGESYAYKPKARACHPVQKDGYWRGYRARIGGTMCYDGYGGSYVVKGSRYLIHYY